MTINAIKDLLCKTVLLGLLIDTFFVSNEGSATYIVNLSYKNFVTNHKTLTNIHELVHGIYKKLFSFEILLNWVIIKGTQYFSKLPAPFAETFDVITIFKPIKKDEENSFKVLVC